MKLLKTKLTASFLSAALCSASLYLGYTSTAYGDGYYGTATLTLQGLIDLAKNPDHGVAHNLKGSFSGITYINHHSPAYNQWLGGGTNYWGSAVSFLLLGQSIYGGHDRIFVPLPYDPELLAIPLTNTENPKVRAYLLPEINYIAQIHMAESVPSLSYKIFRGTFTHPNTNGLTVTSGASPRSAYLEFNFGYNQKISDNEGFKSLTLLNNDNYRVFVDKGATAGTFKYQGNTIYVSMPGMSNEAMAYLTININSDLKLARVCQISNVVNSDFNVVMGRENEIIKESQLTFSCSGKTGLPVYISASPIEGHVNSADPTKLMLSSLDNVKETKLPWVIGRPFINGSNSSISCNEAGANDLLKFNSTDLQLPFNMTTGDTYNMGIKWAICSKEDVPAGKYRGKAIVSIFTKV
ncbi:MAG: hypothetical protein ACQEWL_08840 [Pseudomonadota bacterium]|uniref:hypothetical protein n=1 Tax=Providencia TaxID=586 RepID=UPI00300D33D6